MRCCDLLSGYANAIAKPLWFGAYEADATAVAIETDASPWGLGAALLVNGWPEGYFSDGVSAEKGDEWVSSRLASPLDIVRACMNSRLAREVVASARALRHSWQQSRDASDDRTFQGQQPGDFNDRTRVRPRGRCRRLSPHRVAAYSRSQQQTGRHAQSLGPAGTRKPAPDGVAARQVCHAGAQAARVVPRSRPPR